MRCLYCKADNDRVIDSRASADGFAIRRRRVCADCSRRYTTYERAEMAPLRVVKKSGDRVAFDRNKVLRGLLTACEKRPVSNEQLEDVADYRLEQPSRGEREVYQLSRLGVHRLQRQDLASAEQGRQRPPELVGCRRHEFRTSAQSGLGPLFGEPQHLGLAGPSIRAASRFLEHGSVHRLDDSPVELILTQRLA